MNEYNFTYYNTRYITIFLAIIWNILIFLLLIIFYNSGFFDFMIEKYLFQTLLFLLVFIFGSLFLLMHYGAGIFSKKMQAIINNDHIDINKSEKKLYYNSIHDLSLETIGGKNYMQKIITGYILTIKYNDDIIKIIVFTGTSGKEKKNCEIFLGFNNALNEKYKETVRK